MFIHRESDTEIHIYHTPQVIDKAVLQAEVKRIDKMLALSREDLDLFIEAFGGSQTTEAIDPNFARRLRDRKAEAEERLKWWDAQTSRVTFTEVKP